MSNVTPLRRDIPFAMVPRNPHTADIGDEGAAMEPVTEHLTWLRLRGHAETSIYARRRALVRLAGWLSRERGKPLPDATADDLYQWRAALTIAPTSVVSYVSHVKGFYQWCVDAGHLDRNPAAGLPTPRTGRRLPRPIGETDLEAAVRDAPARIRPWLVLAAWSGLRAREIAYLRRKDIRDNATPPVLVIPETAAKGRHERIVPASAYVLTELRSHGLPARGYVFRRRDGRPGPNAPWVVSGLTNDYLHDCGIPATLHQLRHRFATQLYGASKDLRLTQELMGHADPATTAGYAAYDRTGAAEAVAGLAAPRRLRRVE